MSKKAFRSLFPRKYRVGVWVRTKSGLVGKVFSSSISWHYPKEHVEYRIKIPGQVKMLYFRESDLRKAVAPVKRR